VRKFIPLEAWTGFWAAGFLGSQHMKVEIFQP